MTASDKLIDLLRPAIQSAVVIHNPSNMFYLTEGYTGEGCVFLTEKRRVILTDFRYTEQAERQAPGFEIIMTDSRENKEGDCVRRLIEQEAVSIVRYEADYLTVAAFGRLKAAVGDSLTWLPLKKEPELLRQVKTPAEVLTMRKAAAITSEAFAAILPKIREGMTEKELQIELDFAMLRLGADGVAFDTIIASGENGSLCHAIPGRRQFRKGDMITMDFGARVGGYCSDMTRTVALGEPSPEMKRVYDTVLRAQNVCENALAAGKNCFDIDRLARELIDGQGYEGRFGHGLGHSVGIDIHEEPRLSYTSHDVLRAGVVITVEPGVYLPGIGGVRIENTCLVKANGCEALTTSTKELIVL